MKKITYILLSACFLLTSCEDFLNRDPDAKVGSGDYFTDEGSLLTYINGFIQKYTPSAADLGYGDGYSDIMATEKSFTFLTNASWTPDLQSGWSISNWTPIYNINYFLVHMREAKGLSEATYNHYEGTALDITKDMGAGCFQMPYRLSPLTFNVDGQEYFNERPISTQQSAFVFVSQMRSTLPDAIGGVLWFGLDDANMTVFTPVYCNTDKVPYPYQQENGDCVTFSWDSAFWIYNWVADMIRPRYNLMVEDMRTVQNTLEDTYAQSQEGIESAALKLYQQNPAKAKEYLTNCNVRKQETQLRWTVRDTARNSCRNW